MSCRDAMDERIARDARAGMEAGAGDSPPAWTSGFLAQLLDQTQDAQHLLAVAHHLPVAGLPPAQHAVAVDDERRAIRDVAIDVVDAVRLDRLAVDVAQQRESEAAGLREGIVREGAIPADREDGGSYALDLRRDLTQAGELGRSDAAPVEAVEREDDVGAAAIVRKRDGPTEGRRQRELRGGLAPAQRVHTARLMARGRSVNRPPALARPAGGDRMPR